MGRKIGVIVAIVLIVIAVFRAMPDWTKAMTVVLIPLLTGLVCWRLIRTKSDEHDQKIPNYVYGLVFVLNLYALYVIWSGFVIEVRHHKWLVLVMLVGLGAPLLYLTATSLKVHPSLDRARQKFASQNIWGGSVATDQSSLRQATPRFYGEILTDEAMHRAQSEYDDRQAKE